MIWVKVTNDAPTNSGQEYENFDDFSAHHDERRQLLVALSRPSSSQMEPELKKRSPN